MRKLTVMLTVGTLWILPHAARAADGTRTPTFARDVAPIFQRNARRAIAPDSMAPMSLVTYEEARPWAQVNRGARPRAADAPWHIDKTVGIQHFKNDRSLSDEQIDTIAALGRRGGAEGRRCRTCRPRSVGPTNRSGASRRNSVRRISSSSRPCTMPATAQDVWWRPIVPTGADRAALGTRDRNPPGDDKGARLRITPSRI